MGYVKALIVGAALAVLTLGIPDSAGAVPAALDGRTFTSVHVSGDPIPGGGPLVVGFSGNRISLFAGCNHGVGEVSLHSHTMVVSRTATTRMACVGPRAQADNWMITFFDERPSWSLSGSTLTLRTHTTIVTLHG